VGYIHKKQPILLKTKPYYSYKNHNAMKKLTALFLVVLLSLTGCGSDDNGGTATDDQPVVTDDFIRAADMSFLPEIEAYGTQYKNSNGTVEDALQTLKNAGVNTIRIRLWKDPANGHSGFAEVKALSQRVKAMGLKVWLTVHYSDTWADPAAQDTPAVWASYSIAQLKTAAQDYTAQILDEIQPDIIQIGNETNDGFMWPLGKLTTNEANYLQLVNAISSTIRTNTPETKIMLHYAGFGTSAEWFFNKTANVDYDYIGLSYYPVWNGSDLAALKSSITSLGQAHNKKVLIAETAYPFTLSWNDWTNNIVGQDNQLVPGYPATATGQLNFVNAVRNLVETSGTGIGFCYWGGEWVAFKGTQATDGSTFENQALWDFDNKALPVLGAFAPVE
jgi:arabinogalactan endo-1,4-beta-galactosidase